MDVISIKYHIPYKRQKTYFQIRTFNTPVNFDDSAVKSQTFLCNNFSHMCLTELLMRQLQKNNDGRSDLSSLECSLTKASFSCCILTVCNHVLCTKKVPGTENINDAVLCSWVFKHYQHLEDAVWFCVGYFSGKEISF